MKFEFATNPDWDNLDRWRREMPGGFAMLLDPANGQTLSPTMPPVWLRNDERLLRGYTHLHQQGSSIDLTIFYTSHASAEDLGDPSKGWFERQVAACDVFAFETHAWNRAEHQVLMDALRGGDRLQPRNGPAAMHARRLQAIQQSNAPHFSFDVENTPADLDQMIISQESKWAPNRYTGPKTDDELQDCADWSVIHSVSREWYMVGKFGYEIHGLGLPKSGERTNAFMHVGAWHADLTRKFRLFGVAVLPEVADLSQENMEYRKEMAGIRATGIIPPRARGY